MVPPPTRRSAAGAAQAVPRITTSEKLRSELKAAGKVTTPAEEATAADSDLSGLGSTDDEAGDGPVIVKAAPSQESKPGPASSKRKAKGQCFQLNHHESLS